MNENVAQTIITALRCAKIFCVKIRGPGVRDGDGNVPVYGVRPSGGKVFANHSTYYFRCLCLFQFHRLKPELQTLAHLTLIAPSRSRIVADFWSRFFIMPSMKCLVTAGPTYEPLDEVRRLTNFSTGGLGTRLGNFLVAAGHEVILMRGYYCTDDTKIAAQQSVRFTTTEDLLQKITDLARQPGPAVEAVFHAAAVSDFSFGKIYEQNTCGNLLPVTEKKVSTRHTNRILVELTPTQKIIRQLRPLFPDALIVGWKYEVDGVLEDLRNKTRIQIVENKTDASVGNGPCYGPGFLLVQTGLEVRCEDETALFSELVKLR